MKGIGFHEHGGPDVLQPVEVPDPVPGPGEAVIKVEYCALNHLDIFVREGWPGLDLPKPHILGSDVSGTIAALGLDVEGWEIGQRVVANPGLWCGKCEYCLRGEHSMCVRYGILGETRAGCYAEYVKVPAQNLMAVPDGFPMDLAASACLVSLTAWRMLINRARLRPGETVAIVGAGGGVNSMAIQIAKLAGAKVLAATSTPEKITRARDLGADIVVNYREEDWAKAAWLWSGKRGVDVVVDNVGEATWSQSIRALARGGRLVTVGATSGPKAVTDIRYVFTKQISIIGSTMGTADDFRRVMQLVWEGKLRPVVDRVLPLDRAKEAHQILEEGKQFGKIVLSISTVRDAARM